MNHLDFMEAIGDLPESYYSECLPKNKKAGAIREKKIALWYPVTVCAACIGIVFTFGYCFRHLDHAEPSNPVVSALTETTSVKVSAAGSRMTGESASPLTTDISLTSLTTEETTTELFPVYS